MPFSSSRKAFFSRKGLRGGAGRIARAAVFVSDNLSRCKHLRPCDAAGLKCRSVVNTHVKAASGQLHRTVRSRLIQLIPCRMTPLLELSLEVRFFAMMSSARQISSREMPPNDSKKKSLLLRVYLVILFKSTANILKLPTPKRCIEP